MIDWKREIAIAYLVKQKVAEVDSNHLWECHLPEVAATEEAIVAVEHSLGFNLDAEHRAFLRHANGWKGFMQNNDAFGVADLVAGSRHQKAIELLQSLEALEPICGFEQNELLPFALSSTSIDLFVIAKPNSQSPGVVLWFAGGVIDRFPSFSEWFLAMVDYNRREYQRFTGQLGN
jgi:hypothetical protein